MLTKTLGISTVLAIAGVSPAAIASPISFQGIHNTTYNDFGVQRATGSATIFGDLDGDGVQDPLAAVIYREREAWMSSDATLPNYVDTPSLVQAQLDPLDTSGGTLRTSFSTTSIGGRQFLRNRVELTVASMQQGIPSSGIANLVLNDPGGNVVDAAFALDFGGGRVLNLSLTSLILPQYDRIGNGISQLDVQRLETQVFMQSPAAIPAGTLSEFSVLSLRGDLVPTPGVIALLVGGTLVSARRRRSSPC